MSELILHLKTIVSSKDGMKHTSPIPKYISRFII